MHRKLVLVKKMLQAIVILFIVALSSTYGHNGGNFRDEASVQADLMPQELNPEFQSQASSPNRRVYMDLLQIPEMPRRPLLPPKVRVRRDISPEGEIEPRATSVAETVKQYSRVIAGIVLIISLVIEIVVYIIEAYQTGGA